MLTEKDKATNKIATQLADDLAEKYIESSLIDGMVKGAGVKAKQIRMNSDFNIDSMSIHVQEFRKCAYLFRFAIYRFLDGYGEYKLTKLDHDKI